MSVSNACHVNRTRSALIAAVAASRPVGAESKFPSLRVRRQGERMTQWVPMRKGVANLFRNRDVFMSANSRYLDALAAVNAPTPAIRNLDKVTERKRLPNGKSVRAFNPLASEERQVFEALSCAEPHVRGFTNRDIRTKLSDLDALAARTHTTKQLSAKVSRLFKGLHVFGLIVKIPRSRRWRMANTGLRVLSSAIQLRAEVFPGLYASAYTQFSPGELHKVTGKDSTPPQLNKNLVQ